MNYENITALAYVLDYHIPTNVNKKAIFTELQQFFQNLLRYISHIPENEVSRIKPKVRNKCEMYYNVKVTLIHTDTLYPNYQKDSAWLF